jgi:hypothetical protein
MAIATSNAAILFLVISPLELRRFISVLDEQPAFFVPSFLGQLAPRSRAKSGGSGGCFSQEKRMPRLWFSGTELHNPIHGFLT